MLDKVLYLTLLRSGILIVIENFLVMKNLPK